MGRGAAGRGVGRLSARRHLVLIGLSGAGKTTVATLVARALGAPACDLDARIAAVAGCSVSEIFETRGEAAFRQLEREAMAAALAEPPQVIAAGGGWAAEPGNLEFARGRALTLYLSVSPAVAARRLAGAVDRPLLADTPVEARLASLLDEREPFYRRAAHTVGVDALTPEAAGDAIVVLARQEGGW